MKSARLNRRDFMMSTVAGAFSAAGSQASTQSTGECGVRDAKGSGGRVLFRSDMSRCLPASAVSRKPEAGRWQLINYMTEDGVKGVMASAKPEHRCGELTLALDATGPHKIFLGINYTKARYPSLGEIEVKLSGDPGFRRVVAETGSLMRDGHSKIGVNREIFNSVHEAYWKTADLTGKSLVFRQPGDPYHTPYLENISNLSYVKLLPLSADERREWQSAPREETRRGAIIYCTALLSGATRGTVTYHPISQSWFEDEFTPHHRTDIKIFIFEALRGNYCLYRTKIGDVGTRDNRWKENWVDPLAAFTRLAHENGLKIFASLRMIGPQYPTNQAPIAWARYYWKHPEWAKRDREGRPLSTWSLAFPEVRRYWLSLLRETLEYGTDGIQLHLNRSTPHIFYEEPVVRSFQEKYGEDPRRLPENDHRWQVHCAEYVTQFIREVRELVDEKPGRELGITIYGVAHKYDPEPATYHPLRYNCDVETWLREGLVHYVMPSPDIKLSLLRKWRELAGDRVHLWPDLMPRAQPAEDYALLAKKFYSAGADGYCLWDGERRCPHISEWAAVQRLGHKDQLERLAQDGPSFYRRVPLKVLAGFSAKESFHDG